MTIYMGLFIDLYWYLKRSQNMRLINMKVSDNRLILIVPILFISFLFTAFRYLK